MDDDITDIRTRDPRASGDAEGAAAEGPTGVAEIDDRGEPSFAGDTYDGATAVLPARFAKISATFDW